MARRGWTGRSLGGAALIIPLGWLLRRCGPVLPRLLGPLLAPLALALLPGLRPALDAWWRRVRPDWPADRRQAAALRQLAGFARMCCDRMCAYTHGDQVRVATTKADARRMRAGLRGGAVLISAHFGAWELASRLLSRLGNQRVHAVMLQAEDPRIRATVDAAMGDRPPLIIDPRNGPAAAVAVASALQAGEPVCFLGDRVMPGQDAVEVHMFGGLLRLPAGPFLIAAAKRAALVSCFMVEVRPGLWALRVHPARRMALPAQRSQRRAALAGWAQAWADDLATVVRDRPDQWWNFQDLWREAHAQAAPVLTAVARRGDADTATP